MPEEMYNGIVDNEQSSTIEKRSPRQYHCSYRYLICFCVSFLGASLTFCFEFLIGLQSVLIKVMGINNTQYNLLISAPTWCDIVTATVGTIIVNKYIGIQWGVVICAIISFIGQLLVSIAAFVNSFKVMLIGRIIFGFVFGTLYSVIDTYTLKWFEDKEVTFAMSITRCITRLGCTFALLIPNYIYTSFDGLIISKIHKLGVTFLVGIGFAVTNIGIRLSQS